MAPMSSARSAPGQLGCAEPRLFSKEAGRFEPSARLFFFLKKSAEHSAFFAEFFAESEPKKNPSILLLLPSRTRRGLG